MSASDGIYPLTDVLLACFMFAGSLQRSGVDTYTATNVSTQSWPDQLLQLQQCLSVDDPVCNRGEALEPLEVQLHGWVSLTLGCLCDPV